MSNLSFPLERRNEFSPQSAEAQRLTDLKKELAEAERWITEHMAVFKRLGQEFEACRARLHEVDSTLGRELEETGRGAAEKGGGAESAAGGDVAAPMQGGWLPSMTAWLISPAANEPGRFEEPSRTEQRLRAVLKMPAVIAKAEAPAVASISGVLPEVRRPDDESTLPKPVESERSTNPYQRGSPTMAILHMLLGGAHCGG